MMKNWKSTFLKLPYEHPVVASCMCAGAVWLMVGIVLVIISLIDPFLLPMSSWVAFIPSVVLAIPLFLFWKKKAAR